MLGVSFAERNSGAGVCDKLDTGRDLQSKLGHLQQFARPGLLRHLLGTDEWQETTVLGLDNRSCGGFSTLGKRSNCCLLPVLSTSNPSKNPNEFSREQR